MERDSGVPGEGIIGVEEGMMKVTILRLGGLGLLSFLKQQILESSQATLSPYRL